MMNNDNKKIMMYMSLGALITIIILYFLGRLKTETYKSGDVNDTEAELMNLLADLQDDEMNNNNKILKMVSGPAPIN